MIDKAAESMVDGKVICDAQVRLDFVLRVVETEGISVQAYLCIRCVMWNWDRLTEWPSWWMAGANSKHPASDLGLKYSGFVRQFRPTILLSKTSERDSSESHICFL